MELLNLPNELLTYILHYIGDVYHIVSVRSVCKIFRTIMFDITRIKFPDRVFRQKNFNSPDYWIKLAFVAQFPKLKCIPGDVIHRGEDGTLLFNCVQLSMRCQNTEALIMAWFAYWLNPEQDVRKLATICQRFFDSNLKLKLEYGILYIERMNDYLNPLNNLLRIAAGYVAIYYDRNQQISETLAISTIGINHWNDTIPAIKLLVNHPTIYRIITPFSNYAKYFTLDEMDFMTLMLDKMYRLKYPDPTDLTTDVTSYSKSIEINLPLNIGLLDSIMLLFPNTKKLIFVEPCNISVTHPELHIDLYNPQSNTIQPWIPSKT